MKNSKGSEMGQMNYTKSIYLLKKLRMEIANTYSYLYGPPPHCEKENRLGNGSISSGGNVENEFMSSALQ